MTDELKVVGKGVTRLDAREKVTGKARFTADMYPYGMLYGVVLRSPYAHAKIKRIDTGKAEKLAGVKAVLTYQNVTSTMFGEVGVVDCPVLPDRVRFVGDEVAAVAAETEAIGRQAIKLIEVEYEELPAALTAEAALKPGAPLIAPPEIADSNLLAGPARTMSKEWGNVADGFEAADRVFEYTYHTSALSHMPIEPRACLARWDDDKLTVWTTTQKPFPEQHAIAQLFGLPATRVRVIAPYIGGGFGGKSGGRLAILAVLLARETGRPVSLRFSREEDMLARTRPVTDIKVKMGLKKDGSFTAIHGSVTIHGGGYNWAISTGGIQSVHNLLRSQSYRYEARSVYTNHPPGGQWRGVMNGPMVFALSQSIDRVAEGMGSDPVDFARKNHVRAGDDSDQAVKGVALTISSCGLDECLDKGAEAIGWAEKWPGWQTPVAVNGPKRIGLGMAILNQGSGSIVQSSGAVVKINTDGTVDFLTPITELGQGAKTTQAQILSEALGIPLEAIRVINADTEVTPVDSSGQVSDSTAHIRGHCTKLAGEDARRQLLERASGQLEVAPEGLDIKQGTIYRKDNPEKAITVKALMAKIMTGLEPVIGRGTTAYVNWRQRVFNYGAHFAMVEVDTETGKIKVLKYVAAHDLGKALNPTIVEGQIYGGVIMGLSTALGEGLIFDGKGRGRNLNFRDYRIATTEDCPEIVPIIVESNDPMGPYGAKGFAQAPANGPAPCLANAIYHAIGIRFTEIPITPEKVFKALQEKGKKA